MAGGTRLRFPESGGSPEQIEEFGRSLVALVDRANPAASPLLLKPSNRTAHTGGERIKRDSPDETALRGWVERLARLSPQELARAQSYREKHAARTPAPALRRLTNLQYSNTVRDLLGELSQPGS